MTREPDESRGGGTLIADVLRGLRGAAVVVGVAVCCALLVLLMSGGLGAAAG